jgi:hypothetical protein
MGYRPVTRTEFDYEVYPPTGVNRPIVLYPHLCRKWVDTAGPRIFLMKAQLPSGRPGLMMRSTTGVLSGWNMSCYVYGKVPRCKKLLVMWELAPGWGEGWQVWTVFMRLYTSYKEYRIGMIYHSLTGTFKYGHDIYNWYNVGIPVDGATSTIDFRVGQELDLENGKILAFHLGETRYEKVPPVDITYSTTANKSWTCYGTLQISSATDGYQHVMIWGPIVFYPLEV